MDEAGLNIFFFTGDERRELEVERDKLFCDRNSEGFLLLIPTL